MIRLPLVKSSHRKLLQWAYVSLLCGSLLTGLAGVSWVTHSQGQKGAQLQPDSLPAIAPGSAYRQANLFSDSAGVGTLLDPLLINPWGSTYRGSTPFWIANQGTSTSTLYQGDVSGSPFVKNTVTVGITIPGGSPTGTVGNSTTDFVVPGPCAAASCPAAFIFASLSGNITAWNPSAPAVGSTQAVLAASHPGRVYTGLANGTNGGGNRLYAADFKNGNIDVYGPTFALTTVSGNFADPTIPTTMGNTFHPYNIQLVGTQLYVTYAKVATDGSDEAGVGNGFVRRFNTDGVRDLTFGINNGALNSPWGVAVAPATFGIFGGALLIGNFGRGNPSIHAYNPTTGAFLGTIQNEAGNGIVIDELWSLRFGNGGNGGDLGTLYFTAGIGNELHGLIGSLKPTTATATSLVQFSSDDYGISEGSGHIDITVTRNGDSSGTTTVDYATFDVNQTTRANQKGDYIINAGTLTLSPGETSQTFRILLNDDVFVEGSETVELYLSNPTNSGLGSPSKAELTITDNDSIAPSANPLEVAQFFVRQQYLDFLNREPDAPGLAYWTSQITFCGANATCLSNRRVTVSAAFFIENEFQATGFFVYLTHKTAFGTRLSYGDYVIGRNLIGAGNDADRTNYANLFVLRPDFRAKYPTTLTNAQYVDNLLMNTTIVDTPFRNALVNGLTGGTETRGSVLRKIAEHPTLANAEYKTAFVAAEYFGYLRRDPDTAGFNFWLNKLNSENPANFRGMVCSFITSAEYQQRLSSVIPRTNAECGTVTPGFASEETQ